MHELGVTQNIVAIVSERAGGHIVKRVTLEIGKLSAVMPEAIRFCFDVCAKNTVLERARLEIIEIDGRARCRDCGHEFCFTAAAGACRCGSRNVVCVAGEELNVKEMEVV